MQIIPTAMNEDPNPKTAKDPKFKMHWTSLSYMIWRYGGSKCFKVCVGKFIEELVYTESKKSKVLETMHN